MSLLVENIELYEKITYNVISKEIMFYINSCNIKIYNSEKTIIYLKDFKFVESKNLLTFNVIDYLNNKKNYKLNNQYENKLTSDIWNIIDTLDISLCNIEMMKILEDITLVSEYGKVSKKLAKELLLKNNGKIGKCISEINCVF